MRFTYHQEGLEQQCDYRSSLSQDQKYGVDPRTTRRVKYLEEEDLGQQRPYKEVYEHEEAEKYCWQ